VLQPWVMEFKILGPLEVWDAGRRVHVRGTKRRATLALLLVNANEVVGTDRFVDVLWGADAPGNAISALHNHISRLRKELGSDVLASEGWGYVLRTDPETIDFHRFERLAAEARALPATEKAERLAEALALWRGPALADLALEDGLSTDLARLEERRLAVLEQRVDADLEVGTVGGLVGELEALIPQNPFREHLRWQLILALYRGGRQAEALEAYRDTRRLLAEQLGLEPSAELRDLERAILSQDPALDAPTAIPPPDGPGRTGPNARAGLPRELDPATPLFGRGAELRFLQGLWGRAKRGSGLVALLQGPPGIGKTRLAAELAREVDEEGGTVVYVPCARVSREAVEQVRRAAASPGNTILVADDLDMATGTLMDSLAALVESVAERPFLLLGTFQYETSPFLSTFLERVDRSGEHRRGLAPLEDAEVRSIASLYAGWSLAHFPLAEVYESTGGIPGLVHRVARDWAQEHTSGRLSELTSQAASEREGLRTAERGLEESVADFQRLRTWSEIAAEDAPERVVCPFKGLATFETADAEFFFGRERLVAELVARLVGARFLGVVGQSGSGKSSAVRAGLLPALADGIIPGSDRWRQAIIRPGRDPVHTLESALSAESGPVLVVIDQLEELFSTCEDERERARFVEIVCSPSEEQIFAVVLRADFYGRCASYPDLAELLAANQVLVGPMQGDELRRAIEFPARRAGLRIQPELVDALVEDVIGEPGGLPLLSTALLELWQGRRGRTLTLESYRETGGVRGAVSRLAEEAYRQLTPDQQLVARAILRRLARTDGDAQVVTRHASLSELDADHNTDAARVVSVLTRARLLTTSEKSVEVAHESLLREWPRLRGWLEEDAEGRRLHGHLMSAAHEWEERGRDSGDLYRGARLTSALDWMSGHAAELNERERRFLTESRDASEREAERQRRTNRRLRLLLAGVVVLLGGAVTAGVIASSSRSQARDEARIARARELSAASEANLRVDPQQSILLALEAVKTRGPSGTVLPEALQSLENAVAASRNVMNVSDAGGGVSFSPDGKRFAGQAKGGHAGVRDAATGKLLMTLGSGLVEVDYGSTGKVIATAGPNGKATIWNARSGQMLRAVVGGNGRVVAAELGRRDSVLATVTESGDLKLWDVATGRKLFEGKAWRGPQAWFPEADVVAFSDDGRTLAVLGGGNVDARVWDVSSGAPLLALSSAGGAPRDVDLSGDGERLAIARADGTIEVRNARTGRLQATALAHWGDVWDVEFSSDGTRLATSGNDGYARVWELGRAKVRELFALPGHTAPVEEVSFSRDGTRLVTGSDDGTARIWDVTLEGARASLLLPGTSPVFSGGVALSPDGRRLVAPSHPGHPVRVWDTAIGKPLLALRSNRGPAQRVSVSPDGTRIATTNTSVLQVWDAKSGRRLYTARIEAYCLSLEFGCVTQAVFSPDGSRLAAGTDDGIVRVLDAATGRPLIVGKGHEGAIFNLAFSPTGSRLATVGADGTARVWSAENGAQQLVLDPSTQEIADVGFSADGKRIVTAGWDGRVRVWDAADGRQLRSWAANQGDLFDMAIATDGRLATTGDAGGIKLWNSSSGEELLHLPSPGKTAVAFSSDGKLLASSVALGRTVTLWPLDVNDLVRLARSRVSRSLTSEECRRYLHVDHCPA
jgi:WD40 repeat protein/DNA-binding SARP family transcriptional activator